MKTYQHYYLIGNEIKKGIEKPNCNGKPYCCENKPCESLNWLSSLQPCEISESELTKISNHVLTRFNKDSPINITDIVEERELRTETKSGSWTDYELVFKHPKQVDVEIEAVEFLEWTLSAGYKLNPHCEQNRWNHIDNINSNKPLMTDGYTTKQLYEIFKNRKP